MPKFIIERDIPGAGRLSGEELRNASRNSSDVLHQLGPDIQWLHSYVTADRITCVYIAPSEKLVREHAQRAGLPASAIRQVRATIDPTTAEGVLASA